VCVLSGKDCVCSVREGLCVFCQGRTVCVLSGKTGMLEQMQAFQQKWCYFRNTRTLRKQSKVPSMFLSIFKPSSSKIFGLTIKHSNRCFPC